MEKPVDQTDLVEEHMAAYVEAADLRVTSLERSVEQLRKELAEKAEQVADLSERQVDGAAKELEAAAAVSQYVALQAAIQDPERSQRIRLKGRAPSRGRAKRAEAMERLSLAELSTLTVDEPRTLAEPALRFIGEVVEAE